MKSLCRPKLCMAVGILCACHDSPDRTPPGAGTGMCSVDIEVVSTPSHDARQSAGWRSGAEFVEIKAAAIDGSGRIFVADGLARLIVELDSSGESRHAFGREGTGPGEFKYPVAVSVLGDGTVAVFDEQLWRVTVLAPDGPKETLRTFQVPAMAGFGQSAHPLIADDGAVFALGYSGYQQSVAASLNGKRRGIGRGTVEVTQLDSARSRWEELFTIPGLEVFVDMDEGALQDIWYGAASHLAVTADYVWSADARAGRIVAMERASNRTCEGVLRSDAAAVTQAERDSFYLARDLEYRGADRVQRARDRRRDLLLPAEKPPLTALVRGEGNSVWIRVAGAAAEEELWLALSPQLHVTASILLPRNMDVLAHRRDRIYVREVDADGVGVVRALTLVPVGR